MQVDGRSYIAFLSCHILQDAYVERLRRDVAMAEQELENVTQKIDDVQRKHNEQKVTVDILNQKLAAVNDNQHQLEDHWQKLLKTLHKQDEKIRNNKVHVEYGFFNSMIRNF